MLEDHATSDVAFQHHAHPLLAFKNRQKRDVLLLHFAQRGERRGVGRDADDPPAPFRDQLASRAERHELLEGAQARLHWSSIVDPRTLSSDTRARLNTIPRCSPPKLSAIADASVWLECSGELIDVRSVDVLRIREATPGIELIEFACPRCRTPHASLRFG